jgi:hypothetical protein
MSVLITDEKEDVDMEGCPTSNGNPNGSASGTTSTGAPGNGNCSAGVVGGNGKGRKSDMPVKKEPDTGGGTGGDGESKDGDEDIKLPIHAVATHPVSYDICQYSEKINSRRLNSTYFTVTELSPFWRMYKMSAIFL